MKLDSTIIGALIIGASIIIGVFVYQYNSDYNVCIREQTQIWKGHPNPKGVALRLCKDIKR